MPRTARASVGDLCYHVINRGNLRATVFHSDGDYRAFVELFSPACERVPMRLVGYCLMPNHFHLVLWPFEDGDLSRFMQWLMTSHVRRYHRQAGTSGHVWQGRFKAFPIQKDEHLLAVLRYVERNPLRAGLVAHAEDWPHSSLAATLAGTPPSYLSESPIERDDSWVRLVNEPQSAGEEAELRRCVNRGAPFGKEAWVKRTARRLAIEASLRPRGRPRGSTKG
jgi:putative transposase